MSTPLRVLLATDSFPPVCGGSGWSTWELMRALVARGHHVEVLKVEIAAGAGIDEGHNGPCRVTTFRATAPNIPFVRNVAKNERLWASLETYLTERLAREPFDILHAQHVMTAVPSIRAGAMTGVPVVTTVRDYWPVCYWSTLIFDPTQDRLCPECSVRMMSECVKPRAGAASIAAWSLIPYMRKNLRTKRQTLARAQAVIAVSTAIARDLRARAPELAVTSVYTIPNAVDMSALEAVYHDTTRPTGDEYVLYAGKLAPNKGVQFLLPAMQRAGLRGPLVVVGDGPLRESMEAQARKADIDLRVLGWLDRHAVWRWMRHATMLAFPSYGPESLSRVLIEAAALGVPIAAMDTGGTRDIISDRVTGLLSADVEAFARDLAELHGDERLRAALGAAARLDVHSRFSAASVAERVEQVYRHLLQPQAA
ncbi:MAG: glycosyltransferase family 4 protein [Acidobacteriota bacterium]